MRVSLGESDRLVNKNFDNRRNEQIEQFGEEYTELFHITGQISGACFNYIEYDEDIDKETYDQLYSKCIKKIEECIKEKGKEKGKEQMKLLEYINFGFKISLEIIKSKTLNERGEAIIDVYMYFLNNQTQLKDRLKKIIEKTITKQEIEDFMREKLSECL